MKAPISLLLCGAVSLMVPACLLAQQAPAQPAPAAAPPAGAKPAKVAKPKKPRPERPPLYRDTNTYPPYQLTWNTSTDQQQVRGVFPHPLMPQRVVLATASGVSISDDEGRTWTPLAAAGADKIGLVNDVAFHPLEPDTFYLGTQSKGVWVTTDKGATFNKVGGKNNGMASDTVVSLIIYAGDGTHQTVLAVHGDAATGLSRTRDGGKTWDTVDPDYHFKRVLGGDGTGQQLYLFGSTLKEPDIQSVYACSTVGEFVTEVMRDVVPTDMVYAPTPNRKPPAIYLTTADGGAFRLDNADSFGLAFNTTPLTVKGVDGWASVGLSWGPNADTINLFLYDPTKAGLIVSSDNLATYRTVNTGLPISPLVKEGAMMRPNANGTVCYAVANGVLAIGRPPAEVPEITLMPPAVQIDTNDDQRWRDLADAFKRFTNDKVPAVEAAKDALKSGDLEQVYRDHQLVVTARVSTQPKPPQSVTIDLTRFGGEADTPLFDDGKHGDGAANDGVYGKTFAILPTRYRARDDEWRTTWPGRVAMGVTATYPDGRHEGAVGVVNIFADVPDVVIWHDGVGSATSTVEGDVTVEPFLNPLAPKQPAYAPRLHKGDVAVRIKIPKGPWKVLFKVPYNKYDIDNRAGLLMYMKLEDGAAPKEINLQMLDEPEFSPPTTTEPLPLLNGMVLNNTFQRIAVPMDKVTEKTPQFQANHLKSIIFSGNSDAPATLVFDGLQATTDYPPPPPPPEPNP